MSEKSTNKRPQEALARADEQTKLPSNEGSLHWKSVSKISDIERRLQYLLSHYEEWEISSLAIPPLGCGNGQLEWKTVGPLIYRYACQMDIPVELSVRNASQ